MFFVHVCKVVIKCHAIELYIPFTSPLQSLVYFSRQSNLPSFKNQYNFQFQLANQLASVLGASSLRCRRRTCQFYITVNRSKVQTGFDAGQVLNSNQADAFPGDSRGLNYNRYCHLSTEERCDTAFLSFGVFQAFRLVKYIP